MSLKGAAGALRGTGLLRGTGRLQILEGRRPQVAGNCSDMLDQGHAWQRSYVGWHLGFWLFIGLAVIRLLTVHTLATGPRLTGFALVAVLSLAYTVIPLGPSAGLTRPALLYLLIAIVVAGLACAVDPTLSMLLFIVYPQVWLFSGPVRNGILLTAVLTVSSVLGFLAAAGWSLQAFLVIVPTMAVSLLFSVLMGVWISRIIDQSAERAVLIGQLEATRSELGQAHHAQGVTAERERMAREIHDTLAQGFTSIIMLAQAARAQVGDATGAALRLDSIEDVARENLSEARALVAAFSPVALDGSTLTDAVRRLGERFAAETSVTVDVEVAGSLAGLSRDQEVVLLRAVQEALANVRRHAHARRVRVRVVAGPGQARVEVVDDGVGFEAGTPSGFGLRGMRDRVLAAGGEVEVASDPGQGTRVSVQLPVPVGAGGADPIESGPARSSQQ